MNRKPIETLLDYDQMFTYTLPILCQSIYCCISLTMKLFEEAYIVMMRANVIMVG